MIGARHTRTKRINTFVFHWKINSEPIFTFSGNKIKRHFFFFFFVIDALCIHYRVAFGSCGVRTMHAIQTNSPLLILRKDTRLIMHASLTASWNEKKKKWNVISINYLYGVMMDLMLLQRWTVKKKTGILFNLSAQIAASIVSARLLVATETNYWNIGKYPLIIMMDGILSFVRCGRRTPVRIQTIPKQQHISRTFTKRASSLPRTIDLQPIRKHLPWCDSATLL